MSSLIHNHIRPVRFLVYIEWILLLVVALTEILGGIFNQFPPESGVNLFLIAILGLLGLKFPQGRRLDKIVYTGVEIGIILLGAIANNLRLFPLLYLIVVYRSCLIFAHRGRAVSTSLIFTLFLLTILYRIWIFPVVISPPVLELLRVILLSFAIVFGLACVFLIQLFKAVLSERKSRDNQEIDNNRVRLDAMRIDAIATHQERSQIALQLQESMQQSLSALNLQLATGLKLLKSHPAKAQYFLGEAKHLGTKTLEDLHLFVANLNSNPLQGKRFNDAIAELIARFAERTGIEPDCRIYLINSIPAVMKPCIYHILQEALTNIHHHAAATRVNIHMMTTTTDLYLVVEDNGKGFNLTEKNSGVGIEGMRQRTQVLGGIFEIETSPSDGCKISIAFPLLETSELKIN